MSFRQKGAETLFRLTPTSGPRADGGRMQILSALAMDDPTQRAQPRLAEITFPHRRLRGEDRWSRDRIEPKVVE